MIGRLSTHHFVVALRVDYTDSFLHRVILKEIDEIVDEPSNKGAHELGLSNFALLVLITGDDPFLLHDRGFVFPKLLKYLLVLFNIFSIELLPALGEIL